jgi:hypothetical protein
MNTFDVNSAARLINEYVSIWCKLWEFMNENISPLRAKAKKQILVNYSVDLKKKFSLFGLVKNVFFFTILVFYKYLLVVFWIGTENLLPLFLLRIYQRIILSCVPKQRSYCKNKKFNWNLNTKKISVSHLGSIQGFGSPLI